MDGVVFRVVFVLIAVVGSVSGSTFSANIISDVNQTAISNSTVVLSCLASESGPVRWCFHRTSESECDEVAFNGRIVNGHSKHYELRENNLTVKSATSDFGGVYMCIEENGQGDWHRIQLTVYDTDAKSVVLAQTGHATALHCGAGTPPFVWFYQSPVHFADQPVLVDGHINYKDRVFIAPSRPTELLINGIQYSDTGLYTCVENAGIGPTRFSIRLDVRGDTLNASVACNKTSEASAVNQSRPTASFTALLVAVMLFVSSTIPVSVLAVLYCRAKKNVREGDDAEKRSLLEDKQHTEHWKCVENLLDEYTPKDSNSAKSWTGDKFMFAVVGQPVLYKACIDELQVHVESMDVDAIVGIDANDSRADLFAMPIAEHLGKSYIPIVAADKLRTADNVIQTTYRSRFHKETIIELVKVPQLPDMKKVVLIDSYWVTGKSTEAAIELIVKAFPAAVVECIVVVAPKKEVRRKSAGKVWPMLTNENLLKALDTEGEQLCDDASMC